MSKRAVLTSMAVVVLALALFSRPVLASIEVHNDFSWGDDTDREQGNGYNIDIQIINQYEWPIWVNQVGARMDWQEPEECHWGEGNPDIMNPGDSFSTSVFVPIPEDTWEGEHGFDILVQMNVEYGDGTQPENWQEFRTGFYVDPNSGDGDGNGDGDGDGDGWNMNIDVDWSSFGTGIDPGGFAVLLVVVIISCVVVIPVVYRLCKTW
jgi:hypothetical protein